MSSLYPQSLAIVQIDGQWHRLLPNNELDILSALGGGPGTILVDEHGVAEPIVNGRATLVAGKSYRALDTKDPIAGVRNRRNRERLAKQNIHVELGIDKLEALMPHLHHDTKPQTGGQNELNTPKEVLEYLIKVGVMRATMPFHRAFYAGIMSGLFVAFGAGLALTVAGGANGPLVQANFPVLPKILLGATFPVALMLILGYGGELFTGNTMYCLLALLHGKIKLWQLARNWTIAFMSNLLGCVFFGYFLTYLTDIFAADPYLSYVKSVGEKKIHLPFGVAFLRGIGANACVCLSVFICLVSRDWTGRLIAMWWPIFTFATIGYEHCVANMFFVPVAMFYGAKVTTVEFITWSLIPSTLGNIVGGGILIGSSAYFLYPTVAAPVSPPPADPTSSGASDGAAHEKVMINVPIMTSMDNDNGKEKGKEGVGLVVPSGPSHDLIANVNGAAALSNDDEEFFSDVDGALMVYFKRYRTKSGRALPVMVEANIIVEEGRPSAVLAVVYPHYTSQNERRKSVSKIASEQGPIVHLHAEESEEKIVFNENGPRSSIVSPSGSIAAIEMGEFIPSQQASICTHCRSIAHPTGGECAFRGIVVMRLSDDKILRVDDNFCELVGYSRRELLTMTIPQITFMDDVNVTRDNVQNRIKRFAKRAPRNDP